MIGRDPRSSRATRAVVPVVLAAAAALAACRGDRQPARDAATPPVTKWQVSEKSFGPVNFGMRLDEANAVFAGRLMPDEPLDSTCDYVEPHNLGADVAFMVVDGNTVARVDVRDANVATVEGARVGDAEDRIAQLYGDRLESEPHKYVKGGHYLVASSKDRSDTTHLIIFETDGRRVTEYRAGRVPEVDWVEGCS